MATNSASQCTNQLKLEVANSLNSVMDQFYKELKANTPVRSGRAKAAWKRYRNVNIGRNEQQVVFANTVPYIQRLDEGYSRQAPNGIVEPSWEQANKKGK